MSFLNFYEILGVQNMNFDVVFLGEMEEILIEMYF